MGTGDSAEPAEVDMDRLFLSAGEVGARMLEVDWDATPLGAPATWPQSLRSVVHVVLSSKFSMWMAWGSQLTFFCNDKYRLDTLGAKYPWALGRPAAEVWAEIWDDIAPRIHSVLRSGEATWDESLQLFLERNGYQEETYHTFSYSPLSGEDGTVAGMLCVVSEDTERVIGERRLDLLRRLGTALTRARTEEEVINATQRELASQPTVLPFALLYAFDQSAGRLAFAVGANPGESIAPQSVALQDSPWSLGDLISHESVLVDDLQSRFAEVPKGAWGEPVSTALLMSIGSAGAPSPYGALVAGLNRFRPFDEGYRGFCELVANQISSSMSNARAYDAERQRAQDLATLDRAKTAFFTNVSHEFRTPLTLILGPVADALNDRDDPLTASQRVRLDTVYQSSERLLKLVNTLLEFSRLESGKAEARTQITDLGAETKVIAEMFRSAIERAGLRFEVYCSPSNVAVRVDPEMWAKIVSNLLSNALKFTFEGGITVRLVRDGDFVELSVKDSGIGIRAEDQVHMFERFHRVEGARSRSFEGSGIGLALVAELIALHDGSITVESAPGEGTSFVVRLAVAPDEGINAAAETRVGAGIVSGYVAEAMRWLGPDGELVSEPSGKAPASGGEDLPTVLVADDNPDMRRYIQSLLEERYNVVAVADGEAALDSVRSMTPDIVISDVMMPKLDGFGLLAAIRGDRATASTPVILLSARAGEESAVEGLDAGADDYLVKPFSAVELLARVRSNLELEHARRAAARREHEIAIELQQALAPVPSPSAQRLEVATFYQPGESGTEVGGDWYETIDLGRSRAALVIGDVMGKGIRAAATMGQLRSIVRAYAGLNMDPAELLEAVDARLRELGGDQIASCVYAVVDTQARSFEYANAGHLPPLVVHNGAANRLEGSLGPPLGAGPVLLESSQVTLESGTTVVFYTDGLVETRADDTDARIDRAAQIASAWNGDVDGLPDALVSDLCPGGSADDVAILVARFRTPQPASSFEIILESDNTGAATARRFASEVAERWSSPPALDDLTLLVSEMATNAILHAKPPVTLRLTHLGDEVLIEISDGSASGPTRKQPQPYDEHGRGLQIMTVVARRWGVITEDNGKTVWATLSTS